MERKPLQPGDSLLLHTKKGDGFQRFLIKGFLSGEGGSALVYRTDDGILKEFFPRDIPMSREEDGTLRCDPESPDTSVRYEQALVDYIRPYAVLKEVRDSDADPSLRSVIPYYEIYYSRDDQSVYIWNADSNLKTFADICDEIHTEPAKNPEYKLVTVLNAVRTLTTCIRILHNAGMVHRDINPSNFGFSLRDGKVLTQSLSLFDIDSVYNVNQGVPEYDVGTEGYTEPEMEMDGYYPDGQTDIYAIGATLFNALVVTEETKQNGFRFDRDAFFDRIPLMVKNSELFRSNDNNAYSELCLWVSRILRKCLDYKSNRYQSCEELENDLDEALYFALPAEITKSSRDRSQWILVDIEKHLDQRDLSTRAMLYHLFRYPLYDYANPEKKAVHILIVGFGHLGQKFMDVCLSEGQLNDIELNVTVITDKQNSIDAYLDKSQRPELTRFFNVDGRYAPSIPDAPPYGNIRFRNLELNPNNPQDLLEKIRPFLPASGSGEDHPGYIFIALGNDGNNQLLAERIDRILSSGEEENPASSYLISYIRSINDAVSGQPGRTVPVFVRKDPKEDELYQDMDRMAFNAHLLWGGGLYQDFAKVQEEYEQPYNHDSCFSNALSIKYKLFNAGIPWTGSDSHAEMADRFFQKLNSPDGKVMKDTLIWLEHRRWVAERICSGWRTARQNDLSVCTDGGTKNTDRKLHTCIVRSEPNQNLADLLPDTAENRKKWDAQIPPEIYQTFDELDRMSIKLHKAHLAQAKAVNRNDVLDGNVVHEIRQLIRRAPEAMTAFQELLACMRDIFDDNLGKTGLYRSLKDRFLDVVGKSGRLAANAESIREQMKTLDRYFFPVIQSKEYRNLKNIDATLIDNLPFVLTYSPKITLAVPLHAGEEENEFGNVAAAAVVSPGSILYLHLAETEKDLSPLSAAMKSARTYLRSGNSHAAVSLAVFCNSSVDESIRKETEEALRTAGEPRLQGIDWIILDTMEEIGSRVSKYLNSVKPASDLFFVDLNRTRLSSLMEGAGVYRNFRTYSFNSRKMCFENRGGSEILRYIHGNRFLTISDMFTFRHAGNHHANNPVFAGEYMELWKKYCSASWAWKNLSNGLSEHIIKTGADNLCCFRKPKTDFASSFGITYPVPYSCGRSIRKVLDALKEKDIIKRESEMIPHNDGYKVRIQSEFDCSADLLRLFSCIPELSDHRSVSTEYNSRDTSILVKYDRLTVTDFDMTALGSQMKPYDELLNYLERKQLIHHLDTSNPKKCNFIFSTRQAKSLLTQAGKILEVYIYHQMRESGYFDDVANSYEIEWDGTQTTNEFDIIATKGFSSVFVECKARKDLEQDFYYKLSSLAKKFGVNATPVLVANTEELAGGTREQNDIQRDRGDGFNIITVWKQSDINSIAAVLAGIMENQSR